jgi:hypothetical protein
MGPARVTVVLLLLGGCRQLLGFEEPTTAATDASIVSDDALADAGVIDVLQDGCTTFSSQLDTCAFTFDTPLSLSGANTYNTTTGVLTTPGGSISPPHVVVTGPAGELDVIVASTVELATTASLRVVGVRPLALVASGDLQIEGTVDLTDGGAGANIDAICAGARGGLGANDNGGGAGGGGGGMQGAGGSGGNGDADGGQSDGGFGGATVALPPGPAGGCNGGRGGSAVGTGGAGGKGGGGILLVSAQQITIAGAINAGGGGGAGGATGSAGGGGGGSGGTIMLEAVMIEITGVVAANGGGGGEGGDAGASGDLGDTGRPSATAALGGSGAAANGGNAANGSAGAQLFGLDASQILAGGGGGGGGGAGFIAVLSSSALVSGVSSPPFVTAP